MHASRNLALPLPLTLAAVLAAVSTFGCVIDVDTEDPVGADDVVDEESDALTSIPGSFRDRWGGLGGSGLQTTSTGFFHIEKPAGAERTWIIDPDGNPIFILGINTVLRTAKVPDIRSYLRRHASFDEVARIEWDRLSDGKAGGYGYYFNCALGFSDTNDLGPGKSPITRHACYGVVLDPSVPPDASFALRSAGGTVLGTEPGDGNHTLGDPWNPAYAALLSAKFAARVAPNDPNLVMYFMGNEIGLFDHPLHMSPGVRDLRRFIWTQCPSSSTTLAPQCAPHAFVKMLRDQYGSVSALNDAWNRNFNAFTDVLSVKPMPGSDSARRCDGECDKDMRRFYRRLIAEWSAVTTSTLRALDPNHLVATPRMSVARDDEYCFWGMEGCQERYVDGRPVIRAGLDPTPFDQLDPFDLVAINVYSRANQKGFDAPWFANGIHKLVEESGKPVIVSEFGVRARIDGWTNQGGAPAFVPNGPDPHGRRGDFYTHDMGRFIAFRNVVGASFHRWADRFDDDDQMNMGIVHRDGSRYQRLDSKIRSYQRSIYARIAEATGL